MSRKADFLVPAGEGFTATKVVLLGKFGISFDGRTTHPFFLTTSTRAGMDLVAVTEGETRAFFGLLDRDGLKEGLLSEQLETLPMTTSYDRCVVWLDEFSEPEIPKYLEMAREQVANRIARLGIPKFLEALKKAKEMSPVDLEAAYLAS